MTERIRVLFLLPSLRRSGAILGLTALAKHLDPSALDVKVVCLDRFTGESGGLSEDLRRAGVRVESYAFSGWPGMARVRRIVARVAAEGARVVHSYGFRTDIVNALGSRGTRRLSFVREDITRNYCADYGRVMGRVFAAVHLGALRRLDGIVAVSDATRRELIRRRCRPERVVHVPNWLDFAWIDEATSSTGRARSAEDGVEVGSIARLIPLKRMDWVVRAMAELRQRHPERRLRLHIVGDGPLRRELEQGAARSGVGDCVLFHGQTEDVRPILRTLDAVVLASRSEGMPRSLMEAMAMGVTCVGPRVGGVQELITDRVNGYLFDPGSYRDFLETLELVLVGRRFLDPAAISASVRERFDVRSAARTMSRLYSDLAGAAARVGAGG